MKRLIIILFGVLLLFTQVNAIDFRMDPVTWTFDTITSINTVRKVQNLGGIYYQGQSGCKPFKLEKPESGIFSDGTPWSVNKALFLAKTLYNDSILEGDRQMAGVYNKDITRTLAFNISVPGTCYVIIKNYYSRNDGSLFNLHFQYRSFEAKWTYLTSSCPLTDSITQIKLSTETIGTFWISTSQAALIYAIRFVPNGMDILHICKDIQPVTEMKTLPNGNSFVDFGKDAFGQVELTLRSNNANDTITVHLGECLKDGQIDRKPGGSRRYKSLQIPLLEGTHTYNPVIPDDGRNTKDRAIHMPMEIGEVLPFRYCEIEGYKEHFHPEDIVRIAVNYQFDDDASYFHCDNDTLNRIWDLCKYTMKATSFSGYYIDGDRERIPYEADALINQLGHYANDCEFTIARRTIDRLLRIPNGQTEWIMQTIMVAWNVFLYSGDIKILSDYVDRLYPHTLMSFVDPETKLVSVSVVEQTDELLRTIGRSDKIEDIVDWPHSGTSSYQSPRGGEDDNFEYTDYNTVVNAYHYEVVRQMAHIYEALGRIEEQKKLEEYCSAFYELFNKSFFDIEKGIYRDGLTASHTSLHSNMFALCFDLVPDEYVKSVADFICSKGMACSVYGSQFLLDALYKAGRAVEAMHLITSNGERSWLNMIEKGATITMEAWDDSFKPNQDWNHAWGAAPANIIPNHLAGIRPLESGFRRAIIRPQIGNLKEVECKLPTIHGQISEIIHVDNNTIIMEIDIPEEIASEVYIPITEENLITCTIDGKSTDNYEIREGFVKILSSLSGKHTLKVNQVTTGIVDRAQNKQEGIMYEISGVKIAKSSKKGLFLKNQQKVLLK